MSVSRELQENINWLKGRLDALPDPGLPSALSAKSLFERLGELEKADAQGGAGWSPAVVSGPRLWRRWQPALSAAAVFVLVALVYWGGIGPRMNSSMGAVPQMSSMDSGPATGGGGTESGLFAEAQDMMPFAVTANDEQGDMAAPRLFKSESLESENGEQWDLAGAQADYQLALSNIVLNIVMDDGAAFTELYTTPGALYEKADFVLVANISPAVWVDGETRTTVANATVTASIKGSGGLEIGQITYTGGCLPAMEWVTWMPDSLEENIKSVEQEYGLTQEQVDSGYIYINVGSRPIIQPEVAYVVFLKEREGSYYLMDSQYALLPVEDNMIVDFSGQAYGTVEQPRLA